MVGGGRWVLAALLMPACLLCQVLSGCAIIVRGQPRGGPPPERQINLSNIRAGTLARRAAAGQPDGKDTPDEVGSPPLGFRCQHLSSSVSPASPCFFAWATLANLLLCQPWAFPAREFLRKKLIGKDVCFSVEYKTSPRREYGMVYLGKGERLPLLGLALLGPSVLARVWGGLAFLLGLLGTGQVSPLILEQPTPGDGRWAGFGGNGGSLRHGLPPAPLRLLNPALSIADTAGENIAESLVAEGLACRREGIRANNPEQSRLAELEEQAKTAKKGMWSEGTGSHTLRDLKYTIENPRHFVDSMHQKPVNAIIEHVRDGSVVRALLLPDYYLVTVMLSGIKVSLSQGFLEEEEQLRPPRVRPLCPTFKREADGTETPEPFAAEAKFFTESRLLQRDVQIVLESCHNQNILGTILHPATAFPPTQNGNITELLLKEGFARCVDWSMAVYTRGAEKLRAAERYAKEHKLRIWRDYVAPTANLDQKEKQFQAKVVQVLNADAIVVKLNSGDYKTIHLSSIRPPRLEGEGPQ
ncbi:hypothetical protein E2320_004479, partial [Naja naja]